LTHHQYRWTFAILEAVVSFNNNKKSIPEAAFDIATKWGEMKERKKVNGDKKEEEKRRWCCVVFFHSLHCESCTVIPPLAVRRGVQESCAPGM